MSTVKSVEILVTEADKAKALADPEYADGMRELVANIHQAFHAVQTGQYKSMDDALEALTGKRPQPIDLDDPTLSDQDRRAAEQLMRRMTPCSCGHPLSCHDSPSTSCNMCLCTAFDDVDGDDDRRSGH